MGALKSLELRKYSGAPPAKMEAIGELRPRIAKTKNRKA
jgi:hypothetical protein